MSRRLLITGATGGLGRALVEAALTMGQTVRATGRDLAAGEALTKVGAEFVTADLVTGDPAALVDGIDSVIHAAALSASWGADAQFVAANVTATERLLGAAKAAGATRFVFVSSPSIFAAFRDRVGIGADDLPEDPPLNAYARTKLNAERLVLASAAPGFATCALRPRALVGPGDRVILPRLAQLASRRRMPLPRGGRALIELTDLRDAAEAILTAEERAGAISGRAINLSGGQPIAVRDVALRLAEALGQSPRLVDLPTALARPLAHVAEALSSGRCEEPVLTRYTLATLAYSQTFDPEPARRLLGWEPRRDAMATLLGEARKLAEARA